MLLSLVHHKRKGLLTKLIASVAILLILNVNPALCACLDGCIGMDVKGADTSSMKMSHHCAKPMVPSEGQTPESSPVADTCPLCNCAVTGASAESPDNAVVNGGVYLPLPLATLDAGEKYNHRLPSLAVGADPPRISPRSGPLFVFNSAFLL
jgi:hypothetical protein